MMMIISMQHCKVVDIIKMSWQDEVKDSYVALPSHFSLQYQHTQFMYKKI